MVFLDGLGGNILQFDLTAPRVINQVTPPPGAIGPLAIRPSIVSAPTEVWVTNGAIQVSILNMTAQTVVASGHRLFQRRRHGV